MSCGMEQSLAGQVVDVVAGEIFPGRIFWENGRVTRVEPISSAEEIPPRWIIPGLVDAHVHVESSLLSPAMFGRAACVHGTVATVSDPHEIANVLGVAGVRWMLEDAKKSPVKIYFGAPSCVPATCFETAGAALGAKEIGGLLDLPEVKYLAEVMNFPAVIGGDPAMLAIVAEAKKRGKRIDGHAPGVIGEALLRYAAAGIETDHECVNLEEARQRVAAGMFVAIREGSAARNFDALVDLLKESPEKCFLCSDDKHPDDLLPGHIDRLLARAVAAGVAPLAALRAATLNPVRHYGLAVGLLQRGDPADFSVVEDLQNFRVRGTWIAGEKVAAEGKCLLPAPKPLSPAECPNRFARDFCAEENFAVTAPESGRKIRVIVALDGQLLTESAEEMPTVRAGKIVADPARDLLKIVVVNRYFSAPVAVGFIRNFGLQGESALASSVAHDSHNIVAVGTDDATLCAAVNAVIAERGGLSAVVGGRKEVLPLPIAGLMNPGDCETVGAAFERLTRLAKEAGCPLRSPFMTLSFMALLVIPRLKLGDKGLFDAVPFAPVPLVV